MSLITEKTLWDIIQEKVPLGKRNSRGWYSVKCPMCGDYQERGGFINDGGFTSYSDWNCGSRFKYEEGSGALSRNARQILEAFGITRNDLVAIRSAAFRTQQPEESEITLKSLEPSERKLNLFTPEVELPKGARLLGSPGNEEMQEAIARYLISRRVDPVSMNIHFSMEKEFIGRAIIPYMRAGKVIYWQARAITPEAKPRYLNCTGAKAAVLYGYDRLQGWDNTPLFVTEGVFDAELLQGVGTLGSAVTAEQIEVLKRSRRRLIFVVDRDKTGGKFGQLALTNGWEITFVDADTSDAAESVRRHGLPYTIYRLMKNSTSASPNFSKIALDLGVLEGLLRNRS